MLARFPKLNPATTLAAGYVMGQGTVFLAQIITKEIAGFSALGATVIFISLFSFAFQFSDFGNLNYITKDLTRNNGANIKDFLLTRSITAYTLTLILVISAYTAKNSPVPIIYCALIPLVAFFAGQMRSGVIEFHGQYKKVALLQNTPWLITGILAPVIAYKPDAGGIIIAFAWVASVFTAMLISKKIAQNLIQRDNISPIKHDGFIEKISYIAPPLGGQILGRLILIFAQANHGLNSVGEFGLVKYLQIGTSLIIGFWLRPIHTIVSKNSSNISANYIITHYRSVFLFALAIPIITITATNLPPLKESNLSSWAIISVTIPFLVAASISSQLNSQVLSAKKFVFIEYTGLVVNGLTFLYFSKNGLAQAIAYGECAQYTTTIILGRIARANKQDPQGKTP